MDQLTTSSRMPLFLWLATAVFIVYGTTIPFNFVSNGTMVRDHIARLTLNPLMSPDTGHRVSIPDFTANILLFTPFGFFGVWTMRRLRSAIARILLLVVLSAVLSASVETLQLFTVDRTSSVADVFANTIGGCMGAVAGILLSATAGTIVRAGAAVGLTSSPVLFPFVIASCVMLAGAWEPFDVTIDVGSVLPKLRLFIHHPLQFGPLTDEALSFLQHLVFTSTLVLWLADLRVRSAARIAAVAGVIVACAAEGSQLFIAARMPGLWDAAVSSAGALAGVPIGMAVSADRPRASLTRWQWCGALIALTAIGVALQQLSPFTLNPAPRAFQWMPFRNYYDFTTSETVSHAAELLLAYFPMGFGLALAARSAAGRRAAVVATALAIAIPVEYLQRFIGGRFPDVTDIGMSLAGACLGAWTATRGWPLFAEEMATISRSTGADRYRSPAARLAR